MVEKWKKRYLHDKAMRDAQCESLGIPIPDDKDVPEYSFTTPKNLFSKFNGKKFWSIFNKSGHSRCIFEECSCFKD